MEKNAETGQIVVALGFLIRVGSALPKMFKYERLSRFCKNFENFPDGLK
jgi:hypothetical protein